MSETKCVGDKYKMWLTVFVILLTSIFLDLVPMIKLVETVKDDAINVARLADFHHQPIFEIKNQIFETSNSC